MGERELVAIRRPSGARSLIAREDYDPARHTLWEDSDAMQGREEEGREEEVTTAPRKRGRPRKVRS